MKEFDDHMGSDGHSANMNAMSAIYYDKNQQLLTSSASNEKRAKSRPTSDRYFVV